MCETGADQLGNPHPTTYDPAKSPIGKAPSEWKSLKWIGFENS